MRFASIVTAAAVIAAAPVVALATGPQMQSGQFISAVRCAAYDSLPQFADQDRDLGVARYQLNSELRRQSPETAVAARHAVRDVAVQANAVATPADATALRVDRDAACAGGAMVAGQAGADDKV